MLHKQEDTQAKEADPFVAETKPRGKWLGRFSGRLAAGWHPSVHVQMSPPNPSPCFSLYGWRCLHAVVSGSLQVGAISAWPGTWPSQALTWPLLTVAECLTGAAPGRDLLWFTIPGNPLRWEDMAPEAVWSTIAVLQCGTDQETAAWETAWLQPPNAYHYDLMFTG